MATSPSSNHLETSFYGLFLFHLKNLVFSQTDAYISRKLCNLYKYVNSLVNCRCFYDILATRYDECIYKEYTTLRVLQLGYILLVLSFYSMCYTYFYKLMVMFSAYIKHFGTADTETEHIRLYCKSTGLHCSSTRFSMQKLRKHYKIVLNRIL